MAEKKETSVPAKLLAADPLRDNELLKSVFPNVLDEYDGPQYTLKLTLRRNNDVRLTGPDNERVVAQSSVTATQIDDLTIRTLSSGMSGGEVTFRLVQPGHATLLDDINKFRDELMLDQSTRPVMFLEINFKGYAHTDDTPNDPVNIAGPYIYKLFISEVAVKIDEKGSEYDVKAIIHNHFGKTNTVSEIPVLTVNKGGTLRQCCENLRIALKNYYLKEKPQYHWQDVYEFDLTDPSLTIDGVNIADVTLDNSALDSNNQDLVGAGSEERSKIDGGEGIEVTGGEIHFRSGIKMDQFFLVMLSMNETFKKKVTRREDGNDPLSPPKPNETFVKWFTVLTDVEELDFGSGPVFDHYRNVYASKFIYKLKVVDSARTDVGAPDEKPNVDQVINRYKQIKERGLLRKAYYYVFTGRNDQITNLDIDFAAGAVIFNPPGLDYGNPKEALAAQLNNAAKTTNMSNEERSDYEKILNVRAKTLQSDKQEDPLFLDSDYQNYSEEYQKLVTKYETKYGKPFGIYADKRSTAVLERQYVQSLTTPDSVQAGTYFGFSNTLFGFAAYQYHIASLGSSLVRLKMTVRGDPWYLGKRQWKNTGNADSDVKDYLLEKRKKPDDATYEVHKEPREGCFYDDHTYFYLQFLSPQISMNEYMDEDDDDTGGYWQFKSQDGTLLKSFSGIYMLMEATNSFSDGLFSTDIEGILLSELVVDEIKQAMDREES